MKKILIVLFAVLMFFVWPVLAQEQEGKEVCLVYFTSQGCGDDCGLTNTFMDSLINEYPGNMTSIKYQIDASEANRNVFEAYRYTYNLPSSVPMVLFGKDDYLLGKVDIYANAENKILKFMMANGTNCPLDSGYIAPGLLGSQSLPGNPQVTGRRGENKTGAIVEDGGEENPSDGSGFDENWPIIPGIQLFNKSDQESMFSFLLIILTGVAVSAIVIYLWIKMQDTY